MNRLEFVASLVKSLVWPATAIVLAVLFRSQVRRALLRLTRLKYKELELDFGQGLKQLEKYAPDAKIRPEPDRKTIAAKRDSYQLLQEASQLSLNFPEPSVAVAWQAVEDELMQAVMRLAVSPDSPSYNSALKNAELLQAQNAIDQHTMGILNRMRNLRNMAVHGGHPASHVTTDEAREFLAFAWGVVDKLRSLQRR